MERIVGFIPCFFQFILPHRDFSPANADFVMQGCLVPPLLCYGMASPRAPLRDEGPFGDHTGYYTLPEPYPVCPITKGPSDVPDHATSEITSGSKLGIDATKKLPGEGFKRP